MTDTPSEATTVPAGAWSFALTRRATVALSTIAFVLAVILFLSTGPVEVSLQALGQLIVGDDSVPARNRIVLMEIRLPRTILAALVGSSLAVAGAVMQGLFRNPLADPGIIGVSSGAALAAVAVIVLGGSVGLGTAGVLGLWALPVAAFFGGLATTVLLYGIATRQGRTSVATMLLAGIAIAALATSMIGLAIFHATDQQLRDFTFWSMGSLSGATWSKIISILPFCTILLVGLPLIARGLNALLLGEAEAFHLGFDTQRLKRAAILLSAGATGAAVSVAGIIGFVGIIAPHLVRLVLGPDHRMLLPVSALSGAILILVTDTLSRTIVAPAELPIGILMGVIGAPVFLSILLRRRSVLDL